MDVDLSWKGEENLECLEGLNAENEDWITIRYRKFEAMVPHQGRNCPERNSSAGVNTGNGLQEIRSKEEASHSQCSAPGVGSDFMCS